MTVVEPGTEPRPAIDGDLQYRLTQQQILADFGVEALRSRDNDALLPRAVALCAEGMRTDLCKILIYQHGPDRLLVSAGVGWKPGIVGALEIGADLQSPAGFALKTGEAVISNHLEDEIRFRTPGFMADHQVKRAINVLIEVHGERYGVLEVDSRDDGQFAAADLAFMRGFANLIGVAIERQGAEERLQDAIAHQELLTREASHRVKNSLTMVSAMLGLQMQEAESEAVSRALGDAQARIVTIAQAHDQLWRGDTVGTVDLGELIADLADKMGAQDGTHAIRCDVAAMTVSADAAIPMGLLVTELVTNAIKYAYGDAGGAIDIGIASAEGRLRLVVSDHGRGLPAGFDAKSSGRKSLGMRMVTSLARQLRGDLRFEDAAPGTRVIVDMPDPRIDSGH